jgi:DNA-binding response OmpR family regulator
MPHMDGKTMFMELSRDSWGMSVPVIILTANSNPETIVQTVRDGVSDYLVKTDHSVHDVVQRVKERLDNSI